MSRRYGNCLDWSHSPAAVVHSIHCSVPLAYFSLEDCAVTHFHCVSVDLIFLFLTLSHSQEERVYIAIYFLCVVVFLFSLSIGSNFSIICFLARGSTYLLLFFPKLLFSSNWIPNLEESDLLLITMLPSSQKFICCILVKCTFIYFILI